MTFLGQAENDVAFATAFGEMAGAGVVDTAAVVPAASADPVVTPDASADPVVTPPVTPETPAAPAASATEQAVLAELTRLQEENAALRAPAAVAPIAAPAAVETPAYTISAEDQATLDMVATEWPEVTKAIKVREDAFKAAVMEDAKKLIAEALAPFQQQLTPIVENAAKSETEKFKATVVAVHSDATALLPEVDKWILTLPRHKQVGANFVLDSGTAQEVVELFTEFKTATGRTTAPVPEPPTPTPAKDESRLHSMEVVSTRRSATTTGVVDETDFSGAFAAVATK